MSLENSFANLADKLPTPIAESFSLFLEEPVPFRKLHRLIDAYEVGLKFFASIIVQEFYARGLASKALETDSKIRERISRPSTGDWMMFLREALRSLKQESQLFS